MIDAIQATTADGVVLRGELMRGSTTTCIVCVHDADGDIDVWRPLVGPVSQAGWSMIALDLRGHGGSDGTPTRSGYALDVDLGVNLARRSGAEHVAIMAAGVGAVAALECVDRAVDESSFALADSLILLSPGPLLDAPLDRLRGEGLATMIVSGTLGPQAADARTILEASIGWTMSVTFATAARGTDLLVGELGAHVADKVGTFLREQAALGGPGWERLQSGSG